ncbi:hypothetical protein IB286_12685 [Spongiibacter sp. KMU-158]|uniref:HD domain-containing protein n=1 Tax=Spongiibacter pelagi TaxID=2760804 RepID=A0A927GWL0_9GAMM|nr:hypothetical protein [Spongiibacter pelagi]MBD2859861.1 hypothetical protein [Spongiibacter pelagi]
MGKFKDILLDPVSLNPMLRLPEALRPAAVLLESESPKQLQQMQFRVMGRMDKMNRRNEPCSKLELGNLMGTVHSVVVHSRFLASQRDVNHGDVISVVGELKIAAGRHVVVIENIQPIDAHQTRPTALLPREWVPESFIPQLRTVIRSWVSLESDALKQFLMDVFYDPANALGFLNVQASLTHHHAYQGGLLDHTADMLEQLLHHPFGKVEGIGRDLCVTLIILHDIGKTVTLVGKSRSERGHYQPHEMAALEILAEPLSQLERTHPMLTNLIRGFFKPRSWYPSKPIKAYQVVSYLDRQSARSPGELSFCPHEISAQKTNSNSENNQ